MAPPTKFNPVTERRLIQAIEQGLPQTLACAHAGVGVATFARWRARYEGFDRQVKEAEARRAKTLVDVIQAAAPRSWQAAAWLLERLHPVEFGRHLIADRPAEGYDEAALRQLALERGIDPDALVQAVARAQAAKEAVKQQLGPGIIPLHARTRGGPA